MFLLKQFEGLKKNQQTHTKKDTTPQTTKETPNVQKIATFFLKGKISAALLIFYSLTFPSPLKNIDRKKHTKTTGNNNKVHKPYTDGLFLKTEKIILVF